MEHLLKGAPVAKNIFAELSHEIAQLYDKGVIPQMVVFKVGNDPASEFYIQNIQKKGKKIGALIKVIELSEKISQEELIARITQVNKDSSVHGIMLQLPLPKTLDQNNVVFAIDPNKDVDGLHPLNAGKLMRGQDCFVPCTPAAVIEIMKFYQINTVGSEIVILGRSSIVGKPLMNLLIQKGEANATVTICHSYTKDIHRLTKQAEVLIVAIGKPNYVDSSYVSDKSIVIDIGINEIIDESQDVSRYVGDVDFDGINNIVQAITPVPGGVGTITTATLLKNLVKATRQLTNN